MGRALTKRDVLIVNRESDSRYLAETLLEEAGLRVLAFDDAEGCLDYLEREAPHVAMVFADLSLDEVRERGLVDTVEARWPWVQVVTTGTPAELGGRPRQSFAMTKPWLPLDLLIAAERARRSV